MADTCSTVRGRGSDRGTLGLTTETAGSTSVSPSRSRKRWSMRTAASARATDDARYRRPSATSRDESHSTNRATVVSFASVASPIPLERRYSAYFVRSRR